MLPDVLLQHGVHKVHVVSLNVTLIQMYTHRTYLGLDCVGKEAECLVSDEAVNRHLEHTITLVSW